MEEEEGEGGRRSDEVQSRRISFIAASSLTFWAPVWYNVNVWRVKTVASGSGWRVRRGEVG